MTAVESSFYSAFIVQEIPAQKGSFISYSSDQFFYKLQSC